MNNVTSFRIGTTWFHVKWDSKGEVGIDQNGGIWSNIMNPFNPDNTDMRINHTENPKYKSEANAVRMELNKRRFGNKEYSTDLREQEYQRTDSPEAMERQQFDQLNYIRR